MQKFLLLLISSFIYLSVNGQLDSTIIISNQHIIAELDNLQDKINQVKSDIKSSNIKEASDLYEMNFELQSYIDNISDLIYERNLAEISLETENDLDEDIEDFEEEEYKSDMQFTPDLKTKVMQSLDDFSFVLGWGINTFIQGDVDEINHKLWGSNNWEIGFVNKKQIGTSKTRVVYGLTLNTHTFKLDNQNFSASDNEQKYVLTQDPDLKKVKVGVRYLQVPLGLGIKAGKKGEIFFGGHVGIKVKSFVKKDFKSTFGEEVESEAVSNYGMNKINYGVNASLGSKRWRIFGKYDINKLFKKGTDRNILTFGLRVGY